MSHSNPQPPRPGARFTLATTIERFPHFRAPAGASGTVVDAEESIISLHLDDYLPGAETWNNDVTWTAEDDYDDAGQPAAQPSTARAFYSDVAALVEPDLPATAETPIAAQSYSFERDPSEGCQLVAIPAGADRDAPATTFEVSHMGVTLGRVCYTAQQPHWYALSAQGRFVNRTQDPPGISLDGSPRTGQITREAAVGLLLAAHFASLPTSGDTATRPR
jgi:hypothetical protein